MNDIKEKDYSLGEFLENQKNWLTELSDDEWFTPSLDLHGEFLENPKKLLTESSDEERFTHNLDLQGEHIDNKNKSVFSIKKEKNQNTVILQSSNISEINLNDI